MAVLQAPAVQAPAVKNSIERSWELYYQVRSQIETPDNISKLILFDLVSGDYAISEDQLGFAAAGLVRQRHPNADVFCMRIGYEASCSFDGGLERLPQ